MDIRWFIEFEAKDEAAKNAVRESVYSAKHILDVAVTILNKQKATLERPKADDYDCPSWSHKQAHLNGELAMLNKVTDLLTIKDKSNA